MRGRRFAILLLVLVSCPDEADPPRLSLSEELGPGQVRAGRITSEDELLTGLGAKGRVGDLKIYNDRIAFVISAAGASEGFHPYGGTILDADLVRPGTGGTAFGEIVWSVDFSVMETTSVEVVEDGTNGPARIRATGGLGELPLYEALLGGIFSTSDLEIEWTIDYVLDADADVLRIEHELFNAGRTEVEVSPLIGFFFGTGARPFFEGFGFSSSNSGAGSPYYAAASDEVSYVFEEPGSEVSVIFGESGIAVSNVGEGLKILARERKTKTQRLYVGGPDLAATIARTGRGGTASTVRVVDGDGQPIAGAHVHVLDPRRAGERDYVARAVADGEGRVTLDLRGAGYEVVATAEDGRISTRVALESDVTLSLPSVGTVGVTIVDEDDRPLPAKLSFVGETPAPTIPGRFGEPSEADGFDRVVFAHDGTADVALPAGRYTLYVSRGIEYEVFQRDLEVVAGARVDVAASIARSVDTPGWMTTDPHIHARLSPDSSDSDLFKVRALAAENIELPVSTDHEAVGDFNPSIELLGLSPWIHGIVGTEITTTQYGHFNAFPVEERIRWYGLDPAGMFAAARAAKGDPVVQVNHPRSSSIGYFTLVGFDRDTMQGDNRLSLDFDGIEVINECGDGSLGRAEVLDWFAFLNAGQHRFATGTLDDHTAGRGRLGLPLTYVGLSAERPADVDPTSYRDAYRNGRLAVSCGPFVDASIGTAGVGGTAQVDDRIDVAARVAAAGWVDVDEVLLIVDGVVRDRAAVTATEPGLRFEGTLSATVAADRRGWAIVWARGDEPHGPWAQGRPSFAFTNPIYFE